MAQSFLNPLVGLLHTWLQGNPRPLEVAAAMKDMECLLEISPKVPVTYALPSGEAQNLITVVRDLVTFLGKHALPLIKALPSTHLPIVSPYAGGITEKDSSKVRFRTWLTDEVQLATLNPGRTGMSALGTNALLTWRLWAIDIALSEAGVHFCVVPGARLPPGVQLPEGYHYSWFGARSTSWDTVGVLIHLDIEGACTLIDDIGNPRLLWFRILGKDSVLVVGAFYGPPGGDLAFWQQLVKEFLQLSARFPGARFILLGDGNIHLNYLVDHNPECVCLHCRQGVIDREVERLLDAAHLRAFNPPVPTHTSGTIVDLVFGVRSDLLVVEVNAEDSFQSDHAFVKSRIRHDVAITSSANLGRVSWASQADWENGLDSIGYCTQQLTTAVDDLLQCVALRPRAFGGTAGQKQRRGLLDMAAWARDVLYVTVGHCCAAVTCRNKVDAVAHKNAIVTRSLTAYQDHTDFKVAAEQAARHQQSRTLNHYRQLRERNQGLAEKFMSQVLKASDCFTIALVDTATGDPLTGQQTVDAVVDDLMLRAQNSFQNDPVHADALKATVAAIVQSGGLPKLLPVSITTPVFTRRRS